MKQLLEVCLVALTLAGAVPMAAQSAKEIPMQRGISVELPASTNATAIPEADKENALIVTVTQDGKIYLGVDPTSIEALPKKIKGMPAGRSDTIAYIKADSRLPYSEVVMVLDTIRLAGVQRFALLTNQPSAKTPGGIVPPKGMEMVFVSPR